MAEFIHFKDIPDIPVANLTETIIVRSATLLIYFLLLVMAVHNTVRYLIYKHRYREFAVMVFYFFTYILISARICQYSVQLTTYLMSQKIRDFIVLADGCSVCLGLSQVALVCDIIITLQLFRDQINL